jgi:hypothetical protein
MKTSHPSFWILLLIASLSGCSVKQDSSSNHPSARDKEEFRSETLSLSQGMTTKEVTDMLGYPQKTSIQTYHPQGQTPWVGMQWHYRGGTVTFRQVPGSGWLLNHW